ncbi:MAG: hypothetical protein RL483_157, partial [Pseudomonadota bacterium]
LLSLNAIDPSQPIEVVVLSKNSADTGMRFFASCKHYDLKISRGAFLAGEDVYPYIESFNASLFLSANDRDVREAIQNGFPAGLILQTSSSDDPNDQQLRIAFDFDGVVANDESEKIYAQNGRVEDFHRYEEERVSEPHDPGPLKDFFSKVGRLQAAEAAKKLDDPAYSPLIRTVIVTARNAPSHERMVRSLQAWGLGASELFLMGGVDKTRVLKVLRAHIFFDDQMAHLDSASEFIPSVLIPFGIRNEVTSK